MRRIDPRQPLSSLTVTYPDVPQVNVPKRRWQAVRARVLAYRPRCVKRDWWQLWCVPVTALVARTAPTRRQAATGRMRDCIRIIQLTGATPETPVGELFEQWRIDAVIAHCRASSMSPVGVGHVSRNLSALRHAVFGTPRRSPRAKETGLSVDVVLSVAAENGSERVRDDIDAIRVWLYHPDPAYALDKSACDRLRHFTRRHGLPEIRMDRLRAERVAFLGNQGVRVIDLPWVQSICWTVMFEALKRCELTPDVPRLDRDGSIPVLSERQDAPWGEGLVTEFDGSAPDPATRPSRAEFRRMMEQKVRDFQKPAELLPAELEAVLANPRLSVVPERAWPEVGAIVTEIMRRSQFRGREVFVKRLRVVTLYVWWAHRQGYQHELQVLLAESTIENWFRRGMPDLRPETRATYRANMRAIARAVNPHNNAPVAIGRSQHKDLRPPYSPGEVKQLLWLAGQVTNKRLRAVTITVMLLGVGAGLDSRDLAAIRPDHITDLGADGILITVRGPRPRKVWLLRAFEEPLRAAVSTLSPKRYLLAPDSKNTVSKNYLSSLYRRLHTMDTEQPVVEQARLRATWLTALMCIPVPLSVLLNAAGLESARSLVDLLPHARKYSEVDAARFLRGERA